MAEGWLDLEGKTVVVTGGSMGIGSHIVSDLLKNGANVVVFDRSKTDIYDSNDRVLMVSGDVTVPEDIDRMIAAAIERFGRIDGLVNNAGVTRVKLLVDYYNQNPEHEYNADDLDFVFNVNVKGVMLMSLSLIHI